MATQAPQNILAPFTILVGADFSSLSDNALRVAKNLAKQCAPALVHALYVIERTEIGGSRDEYAALEQQGCAELERHLESNGLKGGIQVHAVVGSASAVLPEIARALRADMLIVGTHSRAGIERVIMGSVAESVMRTAPCSVLVVRERELAPEELIEAARPGQDLHEHHARAYVPLASAATYGMGALTERAPGS